MNFTEGKKYNMGKIAQVYCQENESLKNIDIKDKSFLLLIIIEGMVTFEVNNNQITAIGPCLICFNEKENPILISKKKLKTKSIYFHPQFLNINMNFELIRSISYGEIAHIHDMFLLKPFLEADSSVPMIHDFKDKIILSFEMMKKELEVQPDWYWSCRTRSYFMEIIIAIERIYGLIGNDELFLDKEYKLLAKSYRVKKAMVYIENNYTEKITLSNIVSIAETNHTTLSDEFKKEINQTPIDYLWSFRVKIAKKLLAFTAIPLKEVCNKTGFSTTSHFLRIFKQHTGKTPIIFRKEALEDRIREIG